MNELDELLRDLSSTSVATRPTSQDQHNIQVKGLEELMKDLQDGTNTNTTVAPSHQNTLKQRDMAKDDYNYTNSGLPPPMPIQNSRNDTYKPTAAPVNKEYRFTQGPIADRAHNDLQQIVGTISPSERSSMALPPNSFTNYNENLVAMAVCQACKGPVYGNELAITALGGTFHQQHFKCAGCTKNLAGGTFFEKDNRPFCEKCMNDAFMLPSCAFCGEKIKGRCINALNKTWHPDHFFCSQCGRQFPPGTGFLEHEGKAYCEEDYYNMFAPKCANCDKPILDEVVSALGKSFHAECFTCAEPGCKILLSDSGSFFDYNGRPYCEQHYHAARGSLCASCQKPITGRCITAIGKKFHPEHFVCAFCKKNLTLVGATNGAAASFKEHDGKPYCVNCHFDYQDLRDTNISFSSSDLSSSSTHTRNQSDHFINRIDAANMPKIIEKVVLSNREKDIVRMLITFRRYNSVKYFIELLQRFWFHCLDHGDQKQLSPILEILSIMPKTLLKDEIEIAFEYLEPWIDENEEYLFSNDSVPNQQELIQHLRWLRYEWDDSKTYDFFFEQEDRVDYRLRKKLGKVERISICEARLSRRIAKRSISQGPCEYLIVEGADTIAAHLCLIQENEFARISWHEVYEVGSGKIPYPESIQSVISRSNALTDWVIYSILFPPHDGCKYVKRHIIIEKLFAVASHLFKLRNFDNMISILIGLQHPAITRLSKTWSKVSDNVKKQCGLLLSGRRKQILMAYCSPTKNWKDLRSAMHENVCQASLDYISGQDRKLPPPGLCYFGLVINDLVLNKEAKQDYIPSASIIYQEPMLNVRKMFFQADTITDLFCIGCQGIDVLGRRCRSTYWNSIFVEDKMPMKPHVYLSFLNIEESVNLIKKTFHLHPSLGNRVVGGNFSVYALSKTIE